ncbi:MAG: phage coat protein [Gemmatimonadales bacterium]|nr:phage coat protein [Gemmatimonadales bacterium]
MNSANLSRRVLAGVAVASAPALAFAQATPVDVSDVVDAIEAAATPIGLIGAAVLTILVAIKVYKWVRRAM